jgi:hypothetical protein
LGKERTVMRSDKNSWQAITSPEITALVAREIERCAPEDAAIFRKAKIEPRKIRFDRGTFEDGVYVVAQIEKKVLFYDDTEDAFEVATPDQDGVIRGLVGQFTLGQALAQIRLGLR